MHPSRPIANGCGSIVSCPTIAYETLDSSDPNLKIIRFVTTTNDQASTSYSPAPVMARSFVQNSTPLFTNTQVITGTAPDGSIVEYVIDNRNGEYDTMATNQMYVEVLPNTHETNVQDNQMNQQEIVTLSNEMFEVVPNRQKSRYSRMSQEARERYNMRRRQRRLENKMRRLAEEEQTVHDDSVEVKTEPQTTDNSAESTANEEMAIMVTDNKSEVPENILQDTTPTPTPPPSQEFVHHDKLVHDTKKSVIDNSAIMSSASSDTTSSMNADIILRNARRAEKARQRYQRMSIEQRREYNRRRTQAKKQRKLAKQHAEIEAHSMDVMTNHGQMTSNEFYNQALNELEQEVLRRTEAAKMTLMQQQQKTDPVNSIDEVIEQVATFGASGPHEEPVHEAAYAEQPQMPLLFIDPQGNPINLPEGSVVEIRQENINAPQTIVIHTMQPNLMPQILPGTTYAHLQTNNIVTIPNNPIPREYINVEQEQPLEQHAVAIESPPEDPTLSKEESARKRRAARARERYHNMSEEHKKQFNARRATALRRARLRDDALCRLGEEAKRNSQALDDATQKNVDEAMSRRMKRAEAARLKYQRMNAQERRTYNANRDANRRSRKREQTSESGSYSQPNSQPSITSDIDIVVDDNQYDFNFE